MNYMGKNHIKKSTSTKNYFIKVIFLKVANIIVMRIKKIDGKMKDEYGGKPIFKFAGLKSKMHSILDESSNEESTNKGHNAFIEFQEFHNTLFQKKILRHQMRGIKSKNYTLRTYKTNKISLSCFDDKRYILRNGIETFAYGHKDKSLI